MSRQLNAMHTGPRREDWETPPDLFAALHAEFGFTLDAAANAGNAKCPAWIEADGLTRPWDTTGAVWLNPPYGKQIGAWVEKAWRESERGATVVCLIPARTDAGWWHDYAMRGEVRFIRRRVKFVGAPYNAPFPSAVVVFRPPARARTGQPRCRCHDCAQVRCAACRPPRTSLKQSGHHHPGRAA